MVMGYSRMLYVEFTLSQSQEHFLSCRRRAFEFFGGVPAKIMADYVYANIPIARRMFEKRKKGYAAMGYEMGQ